MKQPSKKTDINTYLRSGAEHRASVAVVVAAAEAVVVNLLAHKLLLGLSEHSEAAILHSRDTTRKTYSCIDGIPKISK